MKIEFIGTGSVTARQLSACTLIDDKILIDAGNGIVKKLKQMNHQIADIEKLFITHLHGDHFADIPFLIMGKFKENKEKTLHIYGPKGTKNKIHELFDLLVFPIEFKRVIEEANVNFIEFEKMEHEKIGEGSYITSYEVQHGNCKPAYGYVLEKEDYTIGFSGDSIYCESIRKLIEQSDFCVLDMSFVNSMRGHMGLDDIEKIAKDYPQKRIATTHMNEDVRQQAKEKNIENLMIPDDGEVIEI